MQTLAKYYAGEVDEANLVYQAVAEGKHDADSMQRHLHRMLELADGKEDADILMDGIITRIFHVE